jgi:hypothetical protein
MKKLLLPAILLLATGANAQIFEEDFEGTTPLDNFTLIGTSGVTVNTAVTGDYPGLTGTTFWTIDNSTGSKAATTTSWFSSAVDADNHLITPQLNLPSGSSYKVSWKATSLGNNSYLDPYQVKLSTTGATAGDFTTELFTNNAGAPNDGESESAIISTTGNVYIAFVANGNDDFLLAFDDIKVEVLPDNDIEMTSLSIAPMAAAGALSISGTVTNVGANDITTFDIDWNDGSAHNETFTQTIPAGGSYTFSHSTDLTVVAGTTHNLNVCASLTGDSENGNDCLTAEVKGASQEGNRLALLELFTSSTCPPCYTLNYTGYNGNGLNAGLDNLNANSQVNPEIAVIKYQWDFPGVGDHAYNSDVDTRISYYGISGIPAPVVNSNRYSGGELNPTVIGFHQNEATFCDISATHSSENGSVTVNVDVTPYANWSGAKVFIALLDKSYAAGSESSFTNNETEFHHVMRKMLPDANGTTVNLVSGTTNTTTETYAYTFNANTPSQGSFDLHAESTQEVVVFVEDANGNILNSAISSGDIATVNDNEKGQSLSVYPNPASDIANVLFSTEENSTVSLAVVNTLGQTVYTNNLGNVNGAQNVSINTSDLDAGMYFVNVTVNGTVSTERISITK